MRYLQLLILVMTTFSLQAKDTPNIIVIYADDLGWKDLGCTGSLYYETPNLDALAAKGMRFTHAYSAANVCAPSRGALLTGRSPARNKFTTVYGGISSPDDSMYDISKQFGHNDQNLEAKHRQTLGSKEVLISERMKNAGYTTGFIGKWHCGVKEGYKPEQRGYDTAVGYYSERDAISSEHYITSLKELVGLPKAKIGDWREDRLSQRACEFITEHKSKPFFLSYHSYLTHGPHVGKKELIGKYQQKKKTDQTNPKYASMVEALDESVGEIIAQLKKHNLLDNTLIIFSSDNGGCSATSNYPLMGGKSFSYEGGYRVPLIAHWPKKIKKGVLNHTRIIGMDLYPTFLEIAGVQVEQGYQIDGKSLWGELMGTSKLEETRPLYFHAPHYTGSSSPHSIIIKDNWKLIRYYNDAEGRFALFNLKKDPEEQQDISASYPEKIKFLDQKLQKYLISIDANFPIPTSSEEGKELIKRFHAGKLKGKINPKAQNSKNQKKNKTWEYNVAMSKRKKAAQNLKK